MTEHICRKHVLESMSKSELRQCLDETVLSEEERKVMELIYLKRKPLGYVADIMGFSESGVKKMHQRIIKRMNNLR